MYTNALVDAIVEAQFNQSHQMSVSIVDKVISKTISMDSVPDFCLIAKLCWSALILHSQTAPDFSIHFREQNRQT